MAYGDDDIVLAAEYALGTLDAEERAQAEAMMSVDPDFRTMVEFWEARLGALNQMVGSIEPRPEVWDRIRLAVREMAPRVAIDTADEANPAQKSVAVAAPPIAVHGAQVQGQVQDQERGNVVDFDPAAARWRRIALTTSAIAAALVAALAVQTLRPELMPWARPPAKQIAQAPAAAPAATPASAQYVALLQNDANQPAFLLTVDAATKNFTARRLGDAPETGRSYELWIVSDRLQRPRSLGVIGAREFTTRTTLAAYDTDIVNRAIYAVSVEPEGGSPTGVATGPVVFKGKLIEAVQGTGGSPQ